MKRRDYIIVALVDETYTNKQKKILHHTGNRPKSPDTSSASDEHQCTTVVQGGALRHSNLYFCGDQLKLSTPDCRNA